MANVPKDSIAVTPEMIEAGHRVLGGRDFSAWSTEENAVVLTEVFCAMLIKMPLGRLNVYKRPVADISIDHLGNILYMFADLHPDDQCAAYVDALAFYNNNRPNKKVASSGVAEQRLVTTASG